ncbi:phosphatidylcholine synthase, partial [Rhizobium ruizarguesonis]
MRYRNERACKDRRLRLVHILTASGSFLDFLGVVAAAEHRFIDMFWWMGLALL